MIDRRTLIRGSAAFAGAALLPRMAFARTGGEKRLFFVMLRGGMDGMALAAPLGDPGFAALRGRWADEYASAPKLDATFTLHPALPNLAALYADGQALVVHAAATRYRERSHFDAQNLLEGGGAAPFAAKDGFLNRFLAMLGGPAKGVALAPAMPLALRGLAPASNYAPSPLPEASAGLLDRIAGLYTGDAELAALWQDARGAAAMMEAEGPTNLRRAADAGKLAAKLLRGNDGPRIAMLDLPGWDSHANQLPMLRNRFGQLDALIGAFQGGMGPAWRDTAMLVVTEFGRTAKINGTNGTDHGTGGAALVLGGAVRGGRVLADWPSLASTNLFEGRDLMPTTALEALSAGVLGTHFGLDADAVMRAVFAGHAGRPMDGLFA